MTHLDSLKCLFTSQTIGESMVIGIITLLIGRIIFHFSINEIDPEKRKKYLNNINLILFVTGVLLHFIIEIAGFNKWYCDKQCLTGLKSLAKV